MKHTISVDVLKFRHHARARIRSLLDREGFIEVETPYLLNANTPDPFIDPIFAVSAGLGDRVLQLHTSPEIWLKKALSLGLEKIYEMGRVFRDDPLGVAHSREFSMLEWYRVGATLDDLINDTKAIFAATTSVARSLGLLQSGNDPDFARCDLEDLFRDLANIDLPTILQRIERGNSDDLQRILTNRGDHLPRTATFEDAFFHVMLKYIEPQLPYETPTVIARWPLQLAALAKRCDHNPHFCERFEIYYRGLEIANAYQECVDGEVLRARFVDDNAERKKLGKPIFSIDEDFLHCMKDLPLTAGIALGIDRLFLAVLGKTVIADLIFGFGDQ